MQISKLFTNNILIYFSFFLICLSFPLFFSINGVTDPFSFWHTAFVHKFLSEAHFPIEDVVYSPKYIPGAISMLLLISKVTAISPKELQFFPVVGLILPVVYYAMCKKFSDYTPYIFIITLIMLNIPTPMTFFTTWPHAFGFLLYLCFIHLLYKVMEHKSPEGVILLFISFFSVHFYSYTAEMWILSFFSCIILLISIVFLISKNELVRKKLLLNLLLSFLVIFFEFNKIFYEAYLPRGRFVSTVVESSKVFFYNYDTFFSLGESSNYAYHTEPNLLLSLSGILYLALTLIVICAGIAYSLYLLLKSKDPLNFFISPKVETYFKYSLLFAGISDLAVYAARGVITLRYVYFIFPLVVLISLKELPLKKKNQVGILLVLLLLVSSHTALSWQGNKISNPTLYKDYEASANWFLENSVQNKALIDLVTGNKYLLESVVRGTYFEKCLITSEHYEMIVNSDNSLMSDLSNYSPYLIINTELKKINSVQWDTYEPFSNYLKDINSNENINKVYNDNKMWIFVT